MTQLPSEASAQALLGSNKYQYLVESHTSASKHHRLINSVHLQKKQNLLEVSTYGIAQSSWKAKIWRILCHEIVKSDEFRKSTANNISKWMFKIIDARLKISYQCFRGRERGEDAWALSMENISSWSQSSIIYSPAYLQIEINHHKPTSLKSKTSLSGSGGFLMKKSQSSREILWNSSSFIR